MEIKSLTSTFSFLTVLRGDVSRAPVVRVRCQGVAKRVDMEGQSSDVTAVTFWQDIVWISDEVWLKYR